MNTQPTNLPFTLDPNYDYILTDADRQKFAPKLATDDWWSEDKKAWDLYGNGANSGKFYNTHFYRRRKSSAWISVKERLPEADAPFIATDGKSVNAYVAGWIEPEDLLNTEATHWQPWTLPALPQPPKPAAEVAFDDFVLKGGSVWSREIWLAAVAWAKENKEAP